MEKKIRLACLADLNELVGLLHELFSQDIEFEPNFENQKSGLQKIIENSYIGEILVLQVEENIVGMVSLLYSISTALGGKVGILEDMIISKDYRNQGYGKELLAEAIQFSKQRNCLRLTLLTDFDNDIAIRFYKSFGFGKSAMIPLRLICK
jgi:ribosomal protein S18 acetylase RimI-like enzyme